MTEKTPKEITLERIISVAHTKSTRLELRDLNLDALPPEIGNLTHLTYLDLSHNRLSALPTEITKLSKLNVISLSDNQFKTLPAEVLKLTNLVSLNLSSNQITIIPSEIAKLANLNDLYLRNNNLSSFPLECLELYNLENLYISQNFIKSLPNGIAKLSNLEDLDVSENLIDSLPPEISELTNLYSLNLAKNKFKTLPLEITKLSNLMILDISGNSLEALSPEIIKLTNLTSLSLEENRFTTFPHEITRLSKLESLFFSENAIESLPSEIINLTNLEELHLYSNQIIGLPKEIGQLTKLKSLSLFNNRISALPAETTNLINLQELSLSGNPLPIPPEILKKVNEPQNILGYYFKIARYVPIESSTADGTIPPAIEVSRLHRQGAIKPLNETKLILVGQGSVGKTSLVEQILYGTYNQNQSKTEGVSINRWGYENDTQTVSVRMNSWTQDISSKAVIITYDQYVNINIWDFGGQEIMHATHQFFLTKRSLYLLVLDSRLTQEENRAEYWLKIIQSFGGESPVLIVGNKIDQHPLDIDRTDLQKKYPNIVGILETSAATVTGIEELKAAITEQVNNLPHVRDLLPETWFTVKTKLEELGRQSNFITQEKYLDLCAENEVSDETSQRTLIGFLHDLGVVLHFQDDPRLESLGILNPQWVTNGVYKILNSHALFQNKGVLTTSMLDEILNLPEYPRGKRLFMVDMMKKFELCYDIVPDKTFLVPDLLPKDEPAELKFNGVPAFEYAYPVLPSSVITRFIVRMNQKIENHFVWRTGVVLKIGENKALVKADIEDRKITIAIDGVEHTRREAIFAIRYELGEIHNSIKGLNPQQRVPIPDAPNSESLDYEYLLQLERDEFYELPVKDGNRLFKVDVRKLLSGVVSETERRQSAGNVTNIYVGGDISGGNIISGNENQANAEVLDKKPKKKN